MPATSWKKGDLVVHPSKLEWGVGEVLTAQSILHEGKPCQRVGVRFTRAGMKVLSTAFANLAVAPAHLTGAAPAGDQPRPLPFAPARPFPPDEPEAAGDLAPDDAPPEPDRRETTARLRALPERATDPFTPLPARLAATLDLYRFEPRGGSLLDWAAAQAGLRDPLSLYSRHELEQHFETFRVALDAHARDLARDLRRQDAAKCDALLAAAPPRAAQSLRRHDGGR